MRRVGESTRRAGTARGGPVAASLVEALLAALIVGSSLAGLITAFTAGARSSERSEHAYLASLLAHELVEEARSLSAQELAGLVGVSRFSPAGHVLSRLAAAGLVEEGLSTSLVADVNFQYPGVYDRFKVTRSLEPVVDNASEPPRQYRLTIQVEWSEEGRGGKTGPSRGTYEAVLTPGVQ